MNNYLQAINKTIFIGLLSTISIGSVTADEKQAPNSDSNLIQVKANSSNQAGFIPATALKPFLKPRKLHLYSSTALIMDLNDGQVLYEKEADKTMPIASLTKLMTAIVTIDKQLDLDQKIRIKRSDRDRLRGSKSRLSYGTILTRRDMLKITLAASENRASKALARTYPGGHKAFIAAMNAKAKLLGMKNTFFKDSSGLHSKNVSTANDLIKLVVAANRYPLIKEFTTLGIDYVTDLRAGWKVEFMNTNRLVRRKSWDISLSKTGYIADAGHCLVMHTEINNRPTAIVLLNSWGKLSKFGDSNRIRRWLQNAEKRAEKTLATL